MARVVYGGSDKWREDTSKHSMQAQLTRTSRKVTRHFIIEDPQGGYDAINEFLNECRPPFSPPGRYPVLGAQLFVDTVDAKPISGVRLDNDGRPTKSQGYPSYTAWSATVTYAPLPYQPSNSGGQPNPTPLLDNLEISTSVGAEAMTLPGSSLFWSDGTEIADAPLSAPIQISVTQYSITKHHFRYGRIPWDTIRSLNSKVNAGAFNSQHPIFPNVKQETLLFNGAQISIRASGDGTIEYSVGYQFMERAGVFDGTDITWSHLYNRNTKTFDKVYRDDAQTKPLYSTSSTNDFDNLLSAQ